MLKIFPSDKISGAKNTLFSFCELQLIHSFTFNLRFLYELKHKVRFSKSECGIFQFRFVFGKVYIFAQQNTWSLKTS